VGQNDASAVLLGEERVDEAKGDAEVIGGEAQEVEEAAEQVIVVDRCCGGVNVWWTVFAAEVSQLAPFGDREPATTCAAEERVDSVAPLLNFGVNGGVAIEKAT